MTDLFIPDDIYLYIIEYLNLSDCISFALSGVSPRFVDFFTRRWGFNFSLSYGLKENLCQKYLSLPYLSHRIWSLNLSDCYWFSKDSLQHSLTKLVNLSELNILGTTLSLSIVVSKVLPNCHNLSRLSAPIVEETWEEFKANIGDLTAIQQEKLQKVSFLQLDIINSDSPTVFLLVFNFLQWCVSCQELYLNFFISTVTHEGRPWDHLRVTSQVIQLSRKELYDKLKWMASLKVFSVKNSRNERCLDDWCRWFVNEMNPTSLELLWLPAVETVTLPIHYQTTGRLKALCLDRLEGPTFTASALERMTHLGGVTLPLPSPVPHLGFIQAYCLSYVDLDNFCRHHPELEHFRIDSRACNVRDESLIKFEERWALSNLRSLVYASINPHPDILEQFVRSCPCLEELHVGRSSTVSIFLNEELRDDAYWSISRLKRLRKLSISGVEFTRGTFLRQVFTGCTQLEALHVAGSFEEEMTFHEDLCRFLPLAKELRDFRYQREEFHNSMLADLLAALGNCEKLERIVIVRQETCSRPIDSKVGDSIFRLATEFLPNLQLLCLVESAETCVAKELSERFNEKVLPSRPSFWFYIGDHLPRGNRAPRVHYDEIIDPADHFSSVPSF